MALPESFERKIKLFQAKNDLPIFLKGGPADRALFGLTVALCGVGLLGIVHMVYTMGFKKKAA